MLSWFQFFWRLLVLKASPDDAPSTLSVLYLSIFFYFVFASVFASLSQPPLQSMFLSGVETILLFFITKLVLWIRQFPERSSQTLTAIFGSGTFLIILSLLFSVFFNTNVEENFRYLFLIGIFFLIWNVTVIANILKHSLALPFVAGLGIALIYVYLSFTITWRFLRIISISQI